MSNIGNQHPDDPTGEIGADLAQFGYELVGINRMRGEFIAVAKKASVTGQEYTAQAIGRTHNDAAHQLVKTLARK